MSKIDLTTRETVPSDFDFCWDLYSEFVRDPMTPLIPGGWKPEVEKAKFKSIWAADKSHLVLYDGTPIGWLAVEEHADRLVIDHLYLRKSHQRKGIGRILVDFIAKRAAKSGKSLEAEVLKSSTAVSFGEKCGFSRGSEKSFSIELTRRD